MTKIYLQFNISSVWREKHPFFQRNNNMMIIILIYILHTRWCKRQTTKKARKYVANKQKTDNSFDNY